MYQVTFGIEGFTSFVSIFLFRVSTEIDTNFQSDENPSKRKLEIMLTEKYGDSGKKIMRDGFKMKMKNEAPNAIF